MPLLVVPVTDYNGKVPVVIGTNVLNLFKGDLSEFTSVKIPLSLECCYILSHQ